MTFKITIEIEAETDALVRDALDSIKSDVTEKRYRSKTIAGNGFGYNLEVSGVFRCLELQDGLVSIGQLQDALAISLGRTLSFNELHDLMDAAELSAQHPFTKPGLTAFAQKWIAKNLENS